LVRLLDEVENSRNGFVFVRRLGSFWEVRFGVHPLETFSIDAKKPKKHVFQVLREALSYGMLLGYAGFSLTSLWERVPYSPHTQFPDLELSLYTEYKVFRTRKLITDFSDHDFQISRVLENTTFERFCEMVLRAKEYIASGDVFQVVLSRRTEIDFSGSLVRPFLRLVQQNPSPYMYYVKFGERRIVGSSPETLFRVKSRIVESFPIAGTREVTGDRARDEKLRQELLKSEKEAAEHVMLVDLARNDLGKVCELGSVKVPIYRKIVKFSKVQHIVSKVVGVLKQSADSFDVLEAVFPAGTVSGAPKIRAIEIIHELEEVPRGPYAGGVGFFEKDEADFAINIRSFYATEAKLYVQAGAGIVADSQPEFEYKETQHKASALLGALGVR